MATRRRIQLELPKLDVSEAQFRSALNDRMRRIQQALDDLDFPPAIATVINTITQGTGLCVIQEKPGGTVDGTNREFFTTHKPSPELIWVQVGGLAMNPLDDYVLTAAEGKITFNAGFQPRENEEIWVWYFCGDAVPPAAAVGTARQFAGGSEAINYGSSATFNINGDCSVGVWCKFSSSSISDSGIVGYGWNSFLASHPFLLLVRGSSNNWNIRWAHDSDPGNVFNTVDFNTQIPNDSWRYIGASRDDSTKTVSLWVMDESGGLLFTDSGTYTNSSVNNDAANSLMMVGNVGNSGPSWAFTQAFAGTIQEHYVWNVTTSEADHEAARTGSPPSSGLVLSVGPSLGDNPEIDDSGNGFTGSVTGTVLVPGHA